MRMHPPLRIDPRDAQPRDWRRTVFLVDPRPSGGGDAGGRRPTTPQDTTQISSAGIKNVPPASPIAPRIDPLVQPFAPLIPVSSEVRIADAGSLGDSSTDQGDDGSGGGRNGGDGAGERPGRGPGTGGGEDGGFGPGTGVTAPRVIREVKPQYTANAMNARIQGTVRLECVVRSDGRVGRVRVLRSLDPMFGLDREAVDAARQWVFTPATRAGTPVDVVVTIELLFTLR